MLFILCQSVLHGHEVSPDNVIKNQQKPITDPQWLSAESLLRATSGNDTGSKGQMLQKNESICPLCVWEPQSLEVCADLSFHCLLLILPSLTDEFASFLLDFFPFILRLSHYMSVDFLLPTYLIPPLPVRELKTSEFKEDIKIDTVLCQCEEDKGLADIMKFICLV